MHVRSHLASRALVVAALAFVTVGLGGCSVIQGLLGGDQVARDSDTQQVTEAGTADVFDLHVGDCFDDESASEITDVPAVPCAEAHDNEVYYLFDLPDGDYPGDEAVSSGADDGCAAQFESFAGIAYDSSTLDWFTITPTEDTWNSVNDREVICSIYDPAGKTSGSLAGAAR